MTKGISTQFKADLLLLLVTFGWGSSYFMMDVCLEHMDPITLNAYRFLGAFAVAAVLTFRKIKSVNLITLKYALYISLTLVVVYICATYGVKYTTQSNAAFFCATSAFFTPMMAFVIKKVIPERKLVLVVALCMIGMALMSFDSQFHVAIGDLFCIICGFAYAFDLLITESGVAHEEVDAFQLGVYQLGFTGIWMLILALIFEEPAMPHTVGSWLSLVFLAIVCTGIAFIAQTIAQQYTTATHVGIIYALEPVFACIVAFLFAGERLLPRAYVGAVIMLIGLLVMEIDFKGIFRKNNA